METPASPPAPDPKRLNPFPGLRPFEPDEDHLFFGRERETDELLRRLRTNRFVSVLGTSGSGKSSLVRSGLIPSLYSGFMAQAGSTWRVAILRPGEDPIGNLAAALDAPHVFGGDPEMAGASRIMLETTLRRSSLGLADCARQVPLPEHENLLVVVDQFEELFRFKESRKEHGSRDEAVAFAKLLLGAAQQTEAPVYVVITMRSDFIGDCLEYPGLPEAINEGQYLIPRMTREELRQAIKGPVAVGGAEIAPRLVARLLNEVGDDPDQLPVLQHALMRTWDAWARDHALGEPLDLGHYEAIGTMANALSRHAEEAYAELAGDREGIAERLFKALTDKQKDGRGVRRPTPVHEVASISGVSDPDVAAVVDVFRRPGRSFLMPPSVVELRGDSILDISHESLMRNWQRLEDWVEEEATSGKSYRRLSRAGRRYEAGQGSLWVDPELALGLQWRDEAKPTEVWARRYDAGFEQAMRFLDRSREAKEQALRAEEGARRTKLRRARMLSVVLGSAAVVTLVFGLFAVRAGRIARQAQRVAQQEAETARAVTDFLVGLFEVVDPEAGQGSSITAREILDQGAGRIDTDLAGQAGVQTRLKQTMGKVYTSLGLYEPAEPLLQDALRMAEADLGPDDPRTIEARHQLAEVYWSQGRYREAETLYREAWETARRVLGADDPATLLNLAGLGKVQESQGWYEQAEEAARTALAGQRKVLGHDHPDALKSLHQLGTALKKRGRVDEAKEALTEAWEAQKRTLGEDHPDAVATMGSLGELYTDLGRFEEADRLYTANLENRRRVLGDEHPKTLAALDKLGSLEQERGLWDRAQKDFEMVLEARRRVLGGEHPNTLISESHLAWLAYLQNRMDESEKLAEHAFETGMRVLGEEHPETREFASVLAGAYAGQGRFSSAESLEAGNLEIYTRLYGEAHPKASEARNNLAVINGNWGKTDRQDELFRENLEISRKAFGEDHPQTLFYMNNMVASHRMQRRYDEAEALGLESLERHERLLGGTPQTLDAIVQLFAVYQAQKRFDEADSLGKVRVEHCRRLFGDRHPKTLDAMAALAGLYQQRGRAQEALPFRQEILAGRLAEYGEEHQSVIWAYYALAWNYQNLDDPKAALDFRKKALNLSRRLADRVGAGPQDKIRYADGLVGAQRELQNPTEAVRYAEQACEMTHHGNRNYLTTLANAYFSVGRTRDAIRVQEAALALVTDDDPRPRDWIEPRLAEFHEKAGNLEPKRRLQAAEIARKKEAAEKPDASPRAKNEYASVLLTADPTDLRNPQEALRVSLAVNEETHFEQPGMVQVLARAYYQVGEREKAVETQERVLTLVPADEIWNRANQENRLRIFRGDGTSEVNPTRVFEGTWSGTIGPLETGFRFERAGEFVNAVNLIELPWIPAGEIWFRVHAQTGAAEIQVADDGWTNLRWQAAEFRYIEPDELLVWHFRDWEPTLFKRDPTS